jgi:hypothetical protein
MEETPLSLGAILVVSLLLLLLTPLLVRVSSAFVLATRNNDPSAASSRHETAREPETKSVMKEKMTIPDTVHSSAKTKDAVASVVSHNSDSDGTRLASTRSSTFTTQHEEEKSPTTTEAVIYTTATNNNNNNNNNNMNNWKCVCQDGASFLPASLLGPMAVLRMGAGQCYHKQA